MKSIKEKFKNLPNDDSFYLVLKYGAIVKFENKSQVPNVQIILRKVDLNTGNFIIDTPDILIYVPIGELDDVRLGSIWKNKNLVRKNWYNYNEFSYEECVKFDFNFIEYPPETISYNQILNALKSSISNIYKVKLADYLQNKMKLINKTKYVKLINGDITILIPAIELYVSTYTPENKIIKHKLLQYDFDKVIDEFIDMDNTKIENSTYFIGLKNRMEISTAKFLAYLKFNSVSRKRVKYLSTSLEFDEGDKDGSYPIRYPIVLPYHPTSFHITTDGIWLNKKVFLVFRINEVETPSDIKVEGVTKQIKENIQEERVKPAEENNSGDDDTIEENDNQEESRQQVLELSLDIDSNNIPGTRTSVERMKTQVRIVDDGKFSYSHEIIDKEVTNVVEDEESKNENPYSYNRENFKNKEITESIEEIKEASEAEQRDSGDMKVTQIVGYASFSNISTKKLFTVVIETLELLRTETFLINYKILDNDFKRKNKFTNSNFYDMKLNSGSKKEDLKDRWYTLKEREKNELKTLGFREYLLVEIELNINKYCYLLEIGKKEKEHYSGLVFIANKFNKILNDTLLKLLEKIIKNRGNYIKKDELTDKFKPVSLDVKYETYKHIYNENTEEYVGLKSNIKRKIKKIQT